MRNKQSQSLFFSYRFLLPLLLCGLFGELHALTQSPARTTSFPTFYTASIAISNHGSGRLGDQLLDYVQVKWLSKEYGIPLLLRSNRHLEPFALYEREQLVPWDTARWPVATKPLTDLEQLRTAHPEKVIFLLEPVSSNEQERREEQPRSPHLRLPWEEATFRQWVRELLTLRQPLQLAPLPQGRAKIAVHLRTGGSFTFDDAAERKRVPLKFPPMSWYEAQLARVLQMVGAKPIYLYLFTDHSKPSEAAKALQKMVKKHAKTKDILFDYRKAPAITGKGVLEDLFSMARFDYLIRPTSNLSLIAAKLGDPLVEIYPEKYVRNKKGTPAITESCMRQRDGTISLLSSP